MRFTVTTVILLSICGVSLGQQRLVDSFHVIYREATDDYLFRARFGYPIEDPAEKDVGFRFSILNDSYLELAYVGDFGVRDDVNPILRRTYPEPPSTITSIPLVVGEDTVAMIVPRSTLSTVGDIELLFPFQFAASTTDGSTEYQAGVPDPYFVALNVPEPSTLVLAAGSVLLAIPLARRRFRGHRAGAMVPRSTNGR